MPNRISHHLLHPFTTSNNKIVLTDLQKKISVVASCALMPLGFLAFYTITGKKRNTDLSNTGKKIVIVSSLVIMPVGTLTFYAITEIFKCCMSTYQKKHGIQLPIPEEFEEERSELEVSEDELEDFQEERIIQPKDLEEAPIFRLPEELLSEIFSYLSPEVLQSLPSADALFIQPMMVCALKEQRAALQVFIRLLEERGFGDIVKDLSDIAEMDNLNELKLNILDIQAQLIEELKKLRTATLKQLDAEIHPPLFMEDIFKLSIIERRYGQVMAVDDTYERCRGLSSLARRLIDLDHPQRAIEIVLKISPNGVFIVYRNRIYENLIEKGYIEETFQLLQEMHSSSEINWLELQALIKILTENGFIEEALQFSSEALIPEWGRNHIFYSMANILVKKGYVAEALEIAKNNRARYELRELANILANNGYLEEAYQFLQKLPVKEQIPSIKSVVNTLALKGHIAEALQMVKKIPQPSRDAFLNEKAKSYVKIHKNDVALQLAQQISNKKLRDARLRPLLDS